MSIGSSSSHRRVRGRHSTPEDEMSADEFARRFPKYNHNPNRMKYLKIYYIVLFSIFGVGAAVYYT